jgi:PAS domain-containing protein
MLTVRTNAALGRLATLQKRADKATAPAAPIVRAAIKELADSLEELRVVNEQLQEQADEGIELKGRLEQERDRQREFQDVMPLACVWTSPEGQIEEANSAAADLMNVSTQHLSGRPLMLFTTERVKFSESLAALRERLTTVVELSAVLRPRERRARHVRLVGRILEHDSRICWFLLETASEADGEPTNSPAE